MSITASSSTRRGVVFSTSSPSLRCMLLLLASAAGLVLFPSVGVSATIDTTYAAAQQQLPPLFLLRLPQQDAAATGVAAAPTLASAVAAEAEPDEATKKVKRTCCNCCCERCSCGQDWKWCQCCCVPDCCGASGYGSAKSSLSALRQQREAPMSTIADENENIEK